MRLIKPYYVIESEINGENILRHIENAARTCYKSEDKAGDWEKTKKFVGGLIKGGHHSTIEHYSLTVRFIIDRGVSHELVRHRLCAFSQESTRYCNYSNEKFGSHITYIIPSWFKIEPGIYEEIYTFKKLNPEVGDKGELLLYKDGKLFNDTVVDENQNEWSFDTWIKSLSNSELSYNTLISNGWTPQQARSVLPNALKTEIVTTANLREWRHILNMRAVGIAGKPHPQMLELMIPLLKELQEKIPVIFDDLKINE